MSLAPIGSSTRVHGLQPSVWSAFYSIHQLARIYVHTGQAEKALDRLEWLARATPAGAG